jgi:hypothetical protein
MQTAFWRRPRRARPSCQAQRGPAWPGQDALDGGREGLRGGREGEDSGQAVFWKAGGPHPVESSSRVPSADWTDGLGGLLSYYYRDAA